MEEVALAEDGFGEGGPEAFAAVEPRPRADDGVGRHAGTAQDLVGEPGTPAFRRRVGTTSSKS